MINRINILVEAALIASVFGGTYFGLFSCGGYVWQEKACFASITLLTIGAVVVPNSYLSPLWKRVAFPIVIFAIFQFSQSVAATFYPEPPSSVESFVR